MKVLKQKKLFSSKEFKLTESKLVCKVSDISGTDEFTVAYENILSEMTPYKTSNIGLLVVGSAIYIVTLIVIAAEFKDVNTTPAILFWLLLPTLIMIGYWLSRSEKWKIPLADGRVIEIPNLPDNKTVVAFLENLLIERNRISERQLC